MGVGGYWNSALGDENSGRWRGRVMGAGATLPREHHKRHQGQATGEVLVHRGQMEASQGMEWQVGLEGWSHTISGSSVAYVLQLAYLGLANNKPTKAYLQGQKKPYFLLKNENCFMMCYLKHSQSRVAEMSYQTIKCHNIYPLARASTANAMLICLHTFSKKIVFQVYGHITVSLSNKNAHLYSSCITGGKSSYSSTAFKIPSSNSPLPY